MPITNGLDKHVFCGKCGSTNVVLRDQAEREAARRILARGGGYSDVWVPVTILIAFLTSICAMILFVGLANETVSLSQPSLATGGPVGSIAFIIVCLIPSAISVLAIAYSRMRSRSPAALQAEKQFFATQQKARDHYDQRFPFACEEYGHHFDHTRAELQDVKGLKSFLVMEKYRESTATVHTSVEDDETSRNAGLPYSRLRMNEEDEKARQRDEDMKAWREAFRDKTGKDPSFWDELFH